MSADNYHLIDRVDGKFIVMMGFASDEKDPVPATHHARFDTLQEAFDHCEAEYTEYGMRLSDKVRAGLVIDFREPAEPTQESFAAFAGTHFTFNRDLTGDVSVMGPQDVPESARVPLEDLMEFAREIQSRQGTLIVYPATC